jgi:uncharacterized membrane-anchored protein
MAILLGAISKNKIYGAFKYLSAADRSLKQWSKKEVADTIYEISKKANKMLEEKGTHTIEIMVYNPKLMKWELVSTKRNYNK